MYKQGTVSDSILYVEKTCWETLDSGQRSACCRSKWSSSPSDTIQSIYLNFRRREAMLMNSRLVPPLHKVTFNTRAPGQFGQDPRLYQKKPCISVNQFLETNTCRVPDDVGYGMCRLFLSIHIRELCVPTCIYARLFEASWIVKATLPRKKMRVLRNTRTISKSNSHTETYQERLFRSRSALLYAPLPTLSQSHRKVSVCCL